MYDNLSRGISLGIYQGGSMRIIYKSCSESNYNLQLKLKGIVQKKLTRVISFITQKVFLQPRIADILYLRLKGTLSLNCTKLVSVAEAKICGLFTSIVCPMQKANSRQPIS
jgi:hypothetical protein